MIDSTKVRSSGFGPLLLFYEKSECRFDIAGIVGSASISEAPLSDAGDQARRSHRLKTVFGLVVSERRKTQIKKAGQSRPEFRSGVYLPLLPQLPVPSLQSLPHWQLSPHWQSSHWQFGLLHFPIWFLLLNLLTTLI